MSKKGELYFVPSSAVIKAKIRRPRGADPKISIGMKLYADPEGNIIARKRAPKGGGHVIGIVITEATSGCETLMGS